MPLIPSQQLLLDAQQRMEDAAKLKEQLEAEGCIVIAVDPASPDGDSMAVAMARQMPDGKMVVMDIDTDERRFAPIELPRMKKLAPVEVAVPLGNRAQRRRAAARARRK